MNLDESGSVLHEELGTGNRGKTPQIAFSLQKLQCQVA